MKVSGMLIRLVAIVVVGALAGCSSEPEIPTISTSQVVQNTQASIDQFIREAKAAPASAPAKLELLLELLNGRVNDGNTEFTPVRDTAVALQELYKQKAPAPKIDAKLAELQQQSQALAAPPAP